jgi:hypothetical protein
MNWCSSVIDWVQTQDASNHGTFLTGVAAIVALLGSPLAIIKWKKQSIEQKKSEIAQSAYLKFKRFIRALQYITSPAILAYEQDATVEASEPKIMHIFDNRVKQSEKEIKDFLQIWDESELYLNESTSALFDSAWKSWAGIKASFATYCQLYGKADAAQFYDRSLGEKTRELLEQYLVKADQVIKPLTWYR